MLKLKLCAIGRSTGIILPEEVRRSMNVKDGDFLFATATPDGILLTPFDPEVAEQVKLGREILKKYRKTFRALAE